MGAHRIYSIGEKCATDGCVEQVEARGYCHYHYILYWWRPRNVKKLKEYGRRDNLKRKYGITPEQWLEIFDAQDGACGICARTEVQLHVDHCQKTNEVRGLLCGKCNRGIGMFDHEIELLETAIGYLEVIT